MDLRANTQVIVTVGPFVDVVDGFTPETGITLGAADEAEIIKHGSTTVVDISAATWAAVTNCDGYYSLTLTTSHTDTEGQMVIVVQDDSVCLPVRMEYRVLSEAAYDSLYVAKDDGFMDVNIKTIGRADTQETEADNLESACSNYSATRGLSGTALPAAAADAAGGVPISDLGGLDLDTMNTNISSILTDTAAIGAAGAGLTSIPWNSAWDAEVQSEVNDALVINNLDHLFANAMIAADAVDNSFAARLVSKSATADFDDYNHVTDSLQAIRDRGDDNWRIGLLQSTTIAALTSQTSFTLTAGSADDDAYNGMLAVITDVSTATQKAVGVISDYTGASKTVTLREDPGVFTMAATDNIEIILISPDILNVLADTAEIGAAGAGLTAVPWNASWDAEVQSEVNDALVALGLDHLLAASVTGTDVTDDSIIASLVSKESTADWDDYVNTTDSLQAHQDSHADDVLDEVYEGTTTFRQFLRVAASALFGKLSGAATTTVSIRDEADSKNRIVATVDADGNRSAVTLTKT
jgi:hypothetical protein